MKEGFDVGLEMSGNPAAFRDMLANMSHGGKIAMLGIPSEEIAIDWNTVIFNMLTIKGIYGREMYETWYKMTVMLQTGLDISPGHHAPLRRTDFEEASRPMPSGQAGKVVLDWAGDLTWTPPSPTSSAPSSTRSAARASTRPSGSSPRRRRPEVRLRDGAERAQPLRQQLPRAGRPSRGDRGGARGPRQLGLRPGVGALHLRHAGDPQGARANDSADFLGTEDTILYSSCFDANGGLFETLLGPRTP